MITAVRKVIVPVSDQQAALDFWTGALGFVLVRDDTLATNAGSKFARPTRICCWY
jgi:catechol 2,3-dioxygenase-like lactoylglutathione lyase family enzyme